MNINFGKRTFKVRLNVSTMNRRNDVKFIILTTPNIIIIWTLIIEYNIKQSPFETRRDYTAFRFSLSGFPGRAPHNTPPRRAQWRIYKLSARAEST